MRALVPALAGMTRMPYRKFLLFNAAGGAVWSAAVVTGGYLAGASWQRIQGYTGTVGTVLGIASVVIVLVMALLHRRPELRERLRAVPGTVARQMRRPGLALSAYAMAGIFGVALAGFAVRLA